MKIGDEVAIKISKGRESAFGKLVGVFLDAGVVEVDGQLFSRQWKRIKTASAARSEIKRRKAEKKRYRV